jgi:hypothetical protein
MVMMRARHAQQALYKTLKNQNEGTQHRTEARFKKNKLVD